MQGLGIRGVLRSHGADGVRDDRNLGWVGAAVSDPGGRPAAGPQPRNVQEGSGGSASTSRSPWATRLDGMSATSGRDNSQ